MDKLITLADNARETRDNKLFREFMKKTSVWDYANINKESYLSLPLDDKEKIIRQYYFDMKAIISSKLGPICCLLCLWDNLG